MEILFDNTNWSEQIYWCNYARQWLLQDAVVKNVITPVTWWRHDMRTIFVLLALCEGNPPRIGGFPSQRASNLYTKGFHCLLITISFSSNSQLDGDLRLLDISCDVTNEVSLGRVCQYISSFSWPGIYSLFISIYVRDTYAPVVILCNTTAGITCERTYVRR